MIFLSHNSKDKVIVEPIAMRLSAIFGQDNIFYDSWSIQPGDGIIDKMDEGLSKCQLFLFFVSNNSLNSNMVKLEWQNAIMKMTKGQTRIVPVRLDNCIIPAILMQSLYIDLFQNGLEVAIRQITDIASGRNIFTPQFNKVSNLLAFKHREDKNIIIECIAQYYMEPISNFAFATPNTENQISHKYVDCAMYSNGFNPNAIHINGNIHLNAIRIDFPQSIVPGFSQKVNFAATTDIPIDIQVVMHESQRDKWEQIPLFEQ